MEKKTLGILGGFIILVIALIILANKQAKPKIISESGTEIPCLPNGHQQVALHIHPIVTVTVDGDVEVVPVDIGIDGLCMREVHTHDTSGTIHVETAKLGKTYTLADFFAVWEKDIEREGYTYEIIQDGELKDSADSVILKDQSSIELRYSFIQ